MMRILFPSSMLLLSGCGTAACLSVARDDPKVEVIYGGVRTDINCIAAGNQSWSDACRQSPNELDYFPKYLVKACSVIDLPLSLVADTVMLPHTIWLTTHKEEVPAKQDPEHPPADASEKPSQIPTTKLDLTSPSN